ncbi:MAG: hypothetical protein DWQ37_07470 [Planctomycetota bacterium]|nr:MAG: hypothetical protein DWQ37_07470 [Planctomycetota bacterium]
MAARKAGVGARGWTFVVISVVVAGGCAGPSTEPIGERDKEATASRQKASAEPGPPEQSVASGKELYAQHCAACHGEDGNGQGLAAQFLFPKPRDFQAGRFRLVSTSNGVPTLDDVVAVLRRGMPGSSMPPWSHLGNASIRRLAEHVFVLRSEGAKKALAAQLEETGDELPPDEIDEIIANLTTPGAIVQAPEDARPTPDSVARGKELYVSKACVQCHGPTGKGDGQQQMVDSEGLPTRPRDLTRGIFKGSADLASVWRRIRTGMPGTPMPSSETLSDGEVTDLTNYVLSLSDEAAREATVLSREHIRARRVSELPATIDDTAWKEVPAVELRMVPLWWRDDAEPDLTIQAAHDGKSICFRLSWADATANEDAARSEDFEDAVAVELFRGASEPFLGMGAPGAVVDMWFWDADRQSAPGIEDINPNIIVDVDPFTTGPVASAEYQRGGTRTEAQPSISLTAAAAGNPIVPGKDVPAASSLETAGPGSATFRPPTSQLVSANGRWKDGRWIVVMSRPLGVDNPSEGVSLVPGEEASLAVAVWDGAVNDRDGKKLVTIWQDLELER